MSKKNRKAATELILKVMDTYPGTAAERKTNRDAYATYLKGLSDKQFEDLMVSFEQKKATLRFCKKNFGDHSHDSDIIAAFEPIYKLVGADIQVRFWHTDPSTNERAVAKFPGMLIYPPNRMLNQMLIKKRRYAKNNLNVDELTGQARGKSRASTYSAPEAIVGLGKGHKYLNMDLLKFRGGDEAGYQLSLESVYATGSYSIDALLDQETNVTSVVMYSVLLNAMHFKNNIWKESNV